MISEISKKPERSEKSDWSEMSEMFENPGASPSRGGHPALHQHGTIVAVGEILFDVFPDGRRIGGAPFNFACQLHALGFPVCFVSSVGPDERGDELRAFMSARGMRTDGLQREDDLPTGVVQVSVDAAGVPAYEIVENRAYDRIRFDAHLHERLLAEKVALLCYGTLAQRCASSREAIGRMLAALGGQVLAVCDLNLRQAFYSRELILDCLGAAKLLKLNEEELRTVEQLFGEERAQPEEAFAQALVERHDLLGLCVTRGEKGSELFLREGAVIRQPAGAATIVDTVGAGDAFTAMLCAGYLIGAPWATTLELASRFAGGLCSVRGALPEDDGFYTPFRNELEGLIKP